MTIEKLDVVLCRLTPKSLVTLDRPTGRVFVNGAEVAQFTPYATATPQERHAMEDYADTLWTHAQDLQAAQEGWPC